ncbi:MAG TPA: FmdB family zinc ribbon protein [Gaiellales bacterium]|jgi:putative FmdB family regulatory protein|nr:FmdB family zinc ribbon protein [Gaiellales bacterium]
MPIYEYRCQNDHRFEVLQKFADEPLTECEVCGAPATRVLHPVAIHFKGSGFYSTDYGRGKKAASDSKAEASSDGKPAEKKAETKGSEGGGAEPKKAAEA